MNSDPHDSAAWRAFGMLDSDESAGFDHAMQSDSDLRAAYGEATRLAAAVAATAVVPVPPRAGQLEKLHRRLGLETAKRVNWPGLTGWAAAIALGAFLCLRPENTTKTVTTAPAPPRPESVHHEAADPEIATVATPAIHPNEEPEDSSAVPEPRLPAFVPILTETDAKAIAKLDTRRLIQQIETLREHLAGLEDRDRERMEPVQGMAWPIVMRMKPPEFLVGPSYGAALLQDDPPITEVLGDALREAEDPDDDVAIAAAPIVQDATPEPTATPIYDAARDTGTLVVNNLPSAAEGEVYNLWVTTDETKPPVYVGRLPKSSGTGSDSFDFSLGGAVVIPKGFMLTRDLTGHPQPPAETNTVLIGPK